MKKYLILILLSISVSIANISAEEIPVLYEYPCVNGIYYVGSTYGHNGVCVIWYDENQIPNFNGSLVIPSSVTINGIVRPVTEVGTFNSNVPIASNHNKPLTSIYIPESVLNITSGVFDENYPIDKVIWDAPNCEESNFNNGIKSIEFGENIVNIPDYLCNYCDSLTSVILGENVASIGEYAFAYCNISSIEIPHTVTNITDRAFWHNDNLKKVIWDAPNCEIYDWYGCWMGNVIEEFVFGEHIVNIPDNCCANLAALKKVTFNSNINSIGEEAFAYCESLSDITLPNSVTSLGESAFDNCENLTSLDIPIGVTEIPQQAFYGCGLKQIYIHDSITKIGVQAFYKCDSLTRIYFGKNLLEIEDQAFGGLYYNNISSIKKIEWNVASNTGNFNFSGVSQNWGNLEEIIFGENVQVIPDYICNSEKILTSVIIGENVQKIGKEAFEGCELLPNISLPNSITMIGESAFYGCKKLTSVELPIQLTELARRVFSFTGLKSIVIHDSIVTIGEDAFYGCDSLHTVYIGKSVTGFRTWDFTILNRSQTPIKKLIWNTACSVEYVNFSAASRNWGNLEEIVFGENVQSIPDNICSYEKNLTSVTISKNVQHIGKYAFEGCESLPNISLPNSITMIGESAFYGCKSFTSIVIPDSISTISHRVFGGCTSLESVIIGSGVTNIGEMAFAYCDSLKTVTVKNSTPPSFTYTKQFTKSNNNLPKPTLIVPCGSRAVYAASAWKQYFESIEEYFPYTIEVSSANEEMGITIMGNIDCTANTVQIIARPNTGYAFDAWNDGSTDSVRTIQLSQDTSLVATFKVQTFNISFVNWDGSLLKESVVNYNTLPIAPSNPERVATAQYSYIFKAWEPEILNAIEDAVYRATYDSVLNEYTITFLNEDGSLIESHAWAYGILPTCSEPTKENTIDTIYHFNGWNPVVEIVTGDAIYQATFRAVPFHTLVFLDWNGDAIDVVKVEEGMAAVTPEEPSRIGYIFAGWSRDLSTVTESMYVIALYEAIQEGIQVIYINQNDQQIGVDYISLTLPSSISDNEHFEGWFVDAGNIMDGLVIRAQYEGITTNVSNVVEDSNHATRKIIKNDTVFIIRDGKTYTLTGQKLR